MNEKECHICGRRCYADLGTVCNDGECRGIFCTVITPLPGKRVSGVLCRDEEGSHHEVNFIPRLSLIDAEKTISGMWKWPITHSNPYQHWTAKEWKEQYGKLPRKGSKQIVIIELTNGK